MTYHYFLNPNMLFIMILISLLNCKREGGPTLNCSVVSGGGEEGGWGAGWGGGGRGRVGGGRGREDGRGEGGDRVGHLRGGVGVGEGEGALFLLPWGGERGGEGSGGGGGEASFLELEGGLGGGFLCS